MKKFALFLLALALMPLCWAVVMATPGLFSMVPRTQGGLFSAEVLALWAGLGLFLAMWLMRFRPVKTYVFAHEMTHAIVGLFFGARPSNLKVTMKGGSVQLTKSNVWITLAPYFIPFYTVLLVLVAAIVRLSLHRLPCPPAWTFAVGFTWCFHMCFTLKSLGEEQPDVKEYGRLFSWILIFLLNAAGILVWVTVTTDLGYADLWNSLWNRMSSAYLATWNFMVNLLHRLGV